MKISFNWKCGKAPNSFFLICSPSTALLSAVIKRSGYFMNTLGASWEDRVTLVLSKSVVNHMALLSPALSFKCLKRQLIFMTAQGL